MRKRFLYAAPAALAVPLLPSFASAAEAAGEAHGSWLQLVFFAANFAAFVWIVVHWGGPMIRGFFADRASSVQESLSRAQHALAEAERMANEAAARRTGLEDEIARLKAQFEAETTHQVRRISELAQSHSQRMRHDAELGATAMVENARRRMRERLAATSASLARDLISANFASDDQSRLIDSFMSKLGQEGQR